MINTTGALQLGIGSYTYMWSIGFEGAGAEFPLGAFDLLERAHQYGIQVVQYGPNLPLSALPGSSLERIIAQSREWNIELEIGSRGVNKKDLLAQLGLARRIGAKLVRCTAERSLGVPLSSFEITKVLEAVLPAFDDAGILLGIENTVVPAKEIARAIESVTSSVVGIVLDTVNSLAVPEGTRELLDVLAPYVVCVHIKDFVVKRQWHSMGFVVEGRPAGQGQLDIPYLLESIRNSGSNPRSAILELWPPQQENWATTVALENRWAEESLGFLRQHIKN